MRTPSLGYQDDTQIGKREIAQPQLKEPIALFLDEKFLCAITLAGAAEEILARLVNVGSEQSIVEESLEAIQKLREAGIPMMGDLSKKKIFNLWNNARNTIKHHDEKSEEIVIINLFDEAYWMIKRALANASKLGIPISNEVDFENWCIVQLHL
ncbi:MAG: hypothetical protein LZF64_10140 [Nitrosomonas sp.]|nr:MAG: hypothetical protein LZF64_10140 [Nitrosomonas sp.]